MANELTGIRSGDGAKMKAEVLEGHVAFRGAIKADVPFEDIVAEARGTLLLLSFQGNTVELGAGARAAQLAARIRSPPSRLERLGVDVGATAALAGPIDPAFRAELGTRAVVAPGVPKAPVDVLFFAVAAEAQLEALPRLKPLVAPGGALWVVHPAALARAVSAAARSAGWDEAGSVKFSPFETATRLRSRAAP